MTKSVPLSVRVSHDDAEFLAALNIDDAKTPSDKIRYLISEARRNQSPKPSGERIKTLLESQLANIDAKIFKLEHDEHCRSDLIELIRHDLIKIAQEYCDLGSKVTDVASLTELESGLADRAVVTFESFLRLGVTRQAPCLDPTAISRRIGNCSELIDLVAKHTN